MMQPPLPRHRPASFNTHTPSYERSFTSYHRDRTGVSTPRGLPTPSRPMKRSLAAATTQSASCRRRRATPCLRSLLVSTFMVAAVVLTHTANVAEAGVLGGKKGAAPVAAATKVKATSPIPPKSTPPSKLRYVGGEMVRRRGRLLAAQAAEGDDHSHLDL